MKTQKSIISCAVIMGLGLVYCTTPETPPEIKPPVAKFNPPEPKQLNQAILSLDKVASPETPKGQLVTDIRYYLQAKAFEERGQPKQAVETYKKALHAAQGSFGKVVFETWVVAYAKQLPEKVSEDIMTQLVLAELDEGQVPDYIDNSGLRNQSAMGRELRRLVATYMTRTIPIQVAGESKELGPAELASDLELFSSVADHKCGSGADDEKAVDPTKFNQALLDLWEGALAKCKGKLSAAAEHFDAVLARQEKQELGNGHYWYASKERINSLRGIGKRKGAADEYNRLMKIWQTKNLDQAALGFSSSEVLLQRINDALWASRYRGLIGDLAGGKNHSLTALQWINEAYGKIDRTSRPKLVEYKAEAYHVLSSRIALENRAFDEAITYSTLGYEIPGVSADWRDRFAWFLGLYNYLAGNPEASIRYWDKLFTTTKNENLKPQLYFWLAKLHYDADHKQEGDFYYHALTEEYPLNYYSVVAPELAEFPDPNRWQKTFEPNTKLNQGLMQLDRFHLDSLRHDPKVKDLLLRAEIVIAAELEDSITHVCINELSRAMRRNYRMADKAYPSYVYLTRLQYAGSQYVQAIGLTTLLLGGSRSFWMDWPDQLTVYFPQPYADIFAASSESSGVSVEVLMGISRQETSFRPKAVSGAGAVGMMQLIPVTARRMASEVGLDAFGIEAKLEDPRINTTLGSAYVKFLDRYYKGFKPAVYAAYNAGEYAVDQWLERRQHSTVIGFIELIPFSETKGYTRNVMRNVKIYEFLARSSETWTFNRPVLDEWFRHLIRL